MKSFSISKVYLNNCGEKMIDINPLPENYCSFDCVFCPLGRTKVKTDESFSFGQTQVFLKNLEKFLKTEQIQTVFINPNGEAFANNRILDIVNLLKKNALKVKIISNGYLFNKEEYKSILNRCDIVIGELAVTNEKHFQKMQRPLKGYTLEEYIFNMQNFRKQYNGEFILDITILKNYSDSDTDIERFTEIVKRIRPDKILVQTPERAKFEKAFAIGEDRLKDIEYQLNLAIG